MAGHANVEFCRVGLEGLVRQGKEEKLRKYWKKRLQFGHSEIVLSCVCIEVSSLFALAMLALFSELEGLVVFM